MIARAETNFILSKDQLVSISALAPLVSQYQAVILGIQTLKGNLREQNEERLRLAVLGADIVEQAEKDGFTFPYIAKTAQVPLSVLVLMIEDSGRRHLLDGAIETETSRVDWHTQIEAD